MPRDMARSLGSDDPAVPTKWHHPELVGPCKIPSSYCLPTTRRSCCLSLNPISMWATSGAGARQYLAFYGQTEPENSLLKASFPTIEAHAIRWQQQHYSIGKTLDQSTPTCWSKVLMGCVQTVCQSRAQSMYMAHFGDTASTSEGDPAFVHTIFTLESEKWTVWGGTRLWWHSVPRRCHKCVGTPGASRELWVSLQGQCCLCTEQDLDD